MCSSQVTHRCALSPLPLHQLIVRSGWHVSLRAFAFWKTVAFKGETSKWLDQKPPDFIANNLKIAENTQNNIPALCSNSNVSSCKVPDSSWFSIWLTVQIIHLELYRAAFGAHLITGSTKIPVSTRSWPTWQIGWTRKKQTRSERSAATPYYAS